MELRSLMAHSLLLMTYGWSATFREAAYNRRAAGAVCIICNQRLVPVWNSLDIVGPAARHFGVFRVFCG